MDTDQFLTYLKQYQGKRLDTMSRITAAISLAQLLLDAAKKNQLPQERRRDALVAGMIQSQEAKAFCSQVADSCFRSKKPKKIVGQFTSLLKQYKIPSFFSPLQKFALSAVQHVGPYFPSLMAKAIQAVLYREMCQVIVPAEEEALQKELKRLKKAKIKINLNRLGEAILGEQEAQKRIEDTLKDLDNPLVDAISIKISSIYSHINLLAWNDTLTHLKERYRIILRHSMRFHKMVYLDMEEYKDLELTFTLFREVLSEPEFFEAKAGIALQSYIPDSFEIQKMLTEWAMKRKGAPIHIRIVKGANLGMEKIEASLKGWPQAPYKTKGEVDANFKAMLHYGLQKEKLEYVQLGIASHNLFDIAYTMILAEEEGVLSQISFEMLCGMAPYIARVVHLLCNNLLLYTPCAKKEEFHTAIAYLMRRLDENTAPDNFLTHLFALRPGSSEWQEQVELFSRSCLELDTLSHLPRRTQNRNKEIFEEQENVPDTDWSRLENRNWHGTILEKWKDAFHEIPLVINDKELFLDKKGKGYSPSDPSKVIHHFSLASTHEAEAAIQAAQASTIDLKRVAKELMAMRSDFIGAMMQESGKTVAEADGEVSEAVDFAIYYNKMARQLPSNLIEGKIALVVTPWNFPCSIPCSAILSSLVTGNSVLFKPACESVLTGWLLCKALWNAGVSKQQLQFITCEDEPVGSFLINHPKIDKVILTGATATAKHFLQMRPTLKLFGETGGKNSIIVTSLADRDLAVKDAVQSAFGYAGQKCSACSLLILEDEVYHDENFKKQLLDAASSLIVGSSFDPATQVNPLIRPAAPHLYRALTALEEGESWLLQPKQDPTNPNLWSPGIKYGVQKGSFTHQTEFFGPLLAVMRAKDLKEAIELANGTPYGLTAGLHSLNVQEQKEWLNAIQAGNCYINRPITGAIVGRQPFGGCKASSFGYGMKVGGPNYLLQLAEYAEHDKQESYNESWEQNYNRKMGLQKHLGQENSLFYKARSPLYFLIHEGDSQEDIERVQQCAKIAGCELIMGYKEVIACIQKESHAYVRALSRPDTKTLEAIASHIACLDIHKPYLDGRKELLYFIREVALSQEMHRYGNVLPPHAC